MLGSLRNLLSKYRQEHHSTDHLRERDMEKARRGDTWCNGQHACFPSLSPMLECGFKARLGLEFLGFSMWHF